MAPTRLTLIFLNRKKLQSSNGAEESKVGYERVRLQGGVDGVLQRRGELHAQQYAPFWLIDSRGPAPAVVRRRGNPLDAV